MRTAAVLLALYCMPTYAADPVSANVPQAENNRDPETLSEITVVSERSPDRVSKSVISGKVLSKVAGSGGDPLAGLQALPGVVSSGNGSEPAVRGSGPGDNAYYVDDLPTGNIFHFGGISVFNADLLKDFNLYSAAFAPHYADVTGAVIDVALRDPRTDRMGSKVNVNLLGADALIEGPINENQSFYFAARRSYIDLFLKQVEQDGITIQIPNYSDYQGKYILKLDDAGKLTFHMQGASDTLRLKVGNNSDLAQKEPIFAGNFAFDNKNRMQAIVLENVLFDSAFNKLALEHLTFDFTNSIGGAGNLYLAQDSWMLREHLTLPVNEGHELALGANYERALTKIDADLKNATCTQFNPSCDFTSAPRTQLKDQFYSQGWNVSAQDRKRIIPTVTLVTGIRHTYENYLRKGYTEPRLGIEWDYTSDTLVTAGWGQHNQMPIGQQVAKEFGNPNLSHLRADHSVLGVSHKVDTIWSWKAETYYKKFSDLIVDDTQLHYVNGASGKAYGFEFLLKKDPGEEQLSGWFALSLSKSIRRNDITGESFRFELDQPINATVVTTYKLDDDWTLGVKWNGHSGTPYTPITGGQHICTGTVPTQICRTMPVYSDINSGTLPFYHRLDVRLERAVQMDDYKIEMYFEWNNLYGRQNVVGYSYDPTYTEKTPVYPFVLPISFGVQAEF
ncbi:MAG: putative TonB-dependent receptor [Gallionellaceae bacterium]|nr:MAG: putative TonB-dependent receptor [Gallionellaceae bacterium]